MPYHRCEWRRFLSSGELDDEAGDIDISNPAGDELARRTRLVGEVCDGCQAMRQKIYDENGALLLTDTRARGGHPRTRRYAVGLTFRQKAQALKIQKTELQTLKVHRGPGVYQALGLR